MTSPRQYDEEVLRQRVKNELRRRIKGVRAALPSSARAARSARACVRAREIPELSSCATLAGYVPIRGELDPGELLKEARARGVRIALPVVDMETGAILLREDVGEREPGPFGIPEPPQSAPIIESVDVVLVPALAVDPRGHRIGWGKGFYDALLPQLAGALRVALVYDFQLVSEVPQRDEDIPVHVVVSDARLIDARSVDD